MQTQVLIIGGGITGTAIARDLALRGIETILVEKDDINEGASGGNHGLLHSGGRYVSKDKEAARECREEGLILKKNAPHCVNDAGGLFVAVEGDDEKYIADFPNHCKECDIPVTTISPDEARELEPLLSDKIIAAYKVEDASIDPFMVSLENITQAMSKGSKLLRNTELVGFNISGNKIKSAKLRNTITGKELLIEAGQFVNAAGAWAGSVAEMAGSNIPMQYSKGTLIISNVKVTDHIVNRLRPPADGDIVVPGGTVSVFGTSSIDVTVDQLNNIAPTVEEVDEIVFEISQMIPDAEQVRYIRAFCGVRPLVGSREGGGSGRSVSRGFTLVNHEEDGLENFATMTGGKLTTFRMMAEKVSDLVSNRLGVTKPCITKTEPFLEAKEDLWTDPGRSPVEWFKKVDPNDTLLCECEMVSKNNIDDIIDSIIKNNEMPTLKDIGLRSRIGKGTCQGTYCSMRVAAHMYNRGVYTDGSGVNDLKNFVQQRWKGKMPVLWNEQICQAELMEAIHCGFFNEEL